MPRSSQHIALLAGIILPGCASTTWHAPSSPRPATSTSRVEPLRPEPAPTSATRGPSLDDVAASTDRQKSDEEMRSQFRSERLLVYRLDVGMRRFQHSWESVEDPLVIGAALTYEPQHWPMGLEAGISYSSADGDSNGDGYRTTNLGLNFGMSKSFWPIREKIVLTFGAGLALNFTRDRLDVFTPPATNTEVKDRDTWLAGYGHTRLAWQYSPGFDIGIDAQIMTGQDISTIGPVRDSDNGQLTLSFGFHR